MTCKLSVVIITKNEEHNIANAINSAKFASEVLILDSGSSDNTCQIALKMGARVEFHEWLGYGKQKNKAVDLALNDWVMVIDADEIITPELKFEILETLDKPNFRGLLVPRLSSFFGKEIRYCGLYPDYSIRIFNKQYGKFKEMSVHESVVIDGRVLKLKNHLKHNAYLTVAEFLTKQKVYATLSGKDKRLLKAILSPIWVFVKIFIIKLGFLEGWRGFVIAYVYARYTFWKYY